MAPFYLSTAKVSREKLIFWWLMICNIIPDPQRSFLGLFSSEWLSVFPPICPGDFFEIFSHEKLLFFKCFPISSEELSEIRQKFCRWRKFAFYGSEWLFWWKVFVWRILLTVLGLWLKNCRTSIKKSWSFGKDFSIGNSKLHLMCLEDCPNEKCFGKSYSFLVFMRQCFGLWPNVFARVVKFAFCGYPE